MSRFRRRQSHDRIERYLRRLRRWAPRAGRDGLVLEARRHLYEATCRLERAGASHDLAQRRAIRDFGPAWRIGLCERGLTPPALTPVMIRIAGAPVAGLRRLRFPRRMRRSRAHRRPRPRIN